jgi:hypothetical protein
MKCSTLDCGRESTHEVFFSAEEPGIGQDAGQDEGEGWYPYCASCHEDMQGYYETRPLEDTNQVFLSQLEAFLQSEEARQVFFPSYFPFNPDHDDFPGSLIRAAKTYLEKSR